MSEENYDKLCDLAGRFHLIYEPDNKHCIFKPEDMEAAKVVQSIIADLQTQLAKAKEELQGT